VKVISQFVVHIAELLEAEGATLLAIGRTEAQALHRAVAGLALGLAFLIVAAALALAGIGLLATGLILALDAQWGHPFAAAATGLILLILAGAALWSFTALTRSRRP
jgi:hypothetical protein